MTDTKANDATRNLIKSVQETNKAIADTAVTTQERNLAFAQSVLENGIEVLKGHAESTRTLMQELVEQARKQKVLEDGIEVLKSEVSLTQSLMQDLGQQFQKQQDAFQALAQESVDAYRDFLFAPLTFWQKALGTAEAATLEGLKNFQKVTEQGLETIQKTTREAASMTEKATRHAKTAE